MKSFLLSLLFSVSTLAQTFSVMGRVIDSTNSQPLSNANVILIKLPDSTAYGTASGKDGKFIIRNLQSGSYILNISFIGYKKFFSQLKLENRSIDLETIFMVPGETKIGDVLIVEKIPPVVINADTTEYNADGFKTHQDASTEDLISKMPGITVSDGKVKAKGEEVKKVTLDGKQFFGDDPTTVLRNVPAEIVDKIQVFDEQSEQSKFTGFDDGNTTKTMNVVTRNRIRNATFGKFSAGYGNDNRYSASANYNNFNNDQRISIIGQLNNINEQNFSREDLMGVMSSSGRRGPGGGMSIRLGPVPGGPQSTGGGFSRGGSDFLVTSMNGLSTTKAFGFNYSDKYFESLTISGSYFFNRSDNDAESFTRREYFLQQNAGQIYSEANSSSSNNTNHRFNMRVDFQIDSLNDITFRPRFSLQQNDGSGTASGQTLLVQSVLNDIYNFSSSDLSAVNSAAELLYRHKFAARGRTFSIMLNGSYNDNEGDSKLFSGNTYYVQSSFSDTINQFTDNFRNGKGISSNIVYTEPLHEKGLLQITTGFNFTKDASDQKKFNLAEGFYSLLDTSLSNVAKKNYSTRYAGTGYRYQDKELSFNANINYNMSTLENDQQFPYTAAMKKSFTSFLPSAMLSVDFSSDQNLHFFYRTNNNDPSITQLQDVLNNSNPVQLSIGNPDLKQDYRHSINLRYSMMNMENYNSMFLMLNASYVNNYIGNRTIIAGRDTINYKNIVLNPGTQLSTPYNMDGYVSFGSSIVYTLPFELIKSNLNFNLDGSYSRIPGMLNDNKGFSNSSLAALGLVIASNFSPDFDFTISGSSTYNKIVSSLRNSYNEDYFYHSAGIRFRVQFWESFVFSGNTNYQYDSGLPETYKRDNVLMNFSLGKKLFSKNQGEIRISAYDIMNQNTNIQRVTADTYIQDTRSNTIGRYFILSFLYQLRSFGS